MNKNNRRSLFICCTAFHIYIAVSIAAVEGIEADIYIPNHFEGAKEYASKLKDMGLFSRVYFVDGEKAYRRNHNRIETLKSGLTSNAAGQRIYGIISASLKAARRLKALMKYLKLDRETNSTYIDYSRNYSEMYYACGVFDDEMFLHFLKFGNDFRFYHIEDGMGTYCNPKAYYFYDLLCGVPFINFRYILRIYSSELYLRSQIKIRKPCRIERLPSLERCEKNDMIISTLFAREELCSIRQKSIILDTVYNETFVPNGAEAYKKLLEAFERALSTGGVVYKYHPRESMADISKPHITAQNIPFEIFCYWNDFSNKTIISIYSTGAFTPKLLFDQEPRVIFLYKLLQKHLIPVDFDENLFDNFKKIYRDQSRVMIPKTVSEFKEMLKICRKSDQ